LPKYNQQDPHEPQTSAHHGRRVPTDKILRSSPCRRCGWASGGNNPAEHRTVADERSLRRLPPRFVRPHSPTTVGNVARRFLDNDPFRYRRSSRSDAPDRHQCHQRTHDWRNDSSARRVRSRSLGWSATGDLCDRLRHAEQV